MTWGAASEEWAHFSDKLSLLPDLLPVVSNPHAKISPNSKMRDLGKTPSRYDANGLVVGIPKWTSHKSTDRDLGRWSQHSDLGICVQTRSVRAVDIDIADPVRAAAVRELVELMVALPQRRRANSGKCLLTFRMPGDFAKRVIRTADGIIEFLATGQQFIAVGTHPSGTRYEWVDGDGVLGLPDGIPELTPAEFECLWQGLVEAFALPDGESRARNGMVPAIPRRADDLQDAAVAWLEENGWVTGFERDGRVDVRCPWEDGHSTDSGPTSTSYFPAGIGGFAQGHFRCLHASCTNRTDGDFFEAVGYSASDFDVVETVANAKGEVEQPLPPFARNRAGRPVASLRNTVMAVRRADVCGQRIAYDTFKDALLIGPAGGEWRPLSDNDLVVMRDLLEGKQFEPVGREMMRDAVQMVALENSFDSAAEWAGRLVWDGVPRVAQFFEDYFGVAKGAYPRAVSLYTWTALAGRCLVPGIKADMVPVLIGLQGTGKTTSIESMCPIDSAFTEVDLEKKDDDIARQLRGKLVAEIAELKGLASRDAESIKAWVSRRTEEWTPKYKEFVTRYDRRNLCIGTGNKNFLDDDTGERRWLPMEVGTVDVERIQADRDQLWAEGVTLFKRSGVAWQEAQRLAPQEHGKFKIGDPWEEAIAAWLQRDDMDGPRSENCVRMLDVLVSCLGFNLQKITRKDELRVGKVLRMLGYEKGVRRVDGVSAKVWTNAQNQEHAANSMFADLA